MQIAQDALVLTRFAQFAAAMVLGGTPLFFLYGPPPPQALWPRRLMSACAAVGAVAIVGWLMAQAALFGDPPDAFAPLKVWSVATETAVGRAALLRLAFFITAFFASRLVGTDRSSWLTSASLGGVLVAAHAWLGHGRTGEGLVQPLHLAADIAHLMAAAVWIGALVPLAVLTIRFGSSDLEAERKDVQTGLEAFSGIGPAVVAVLILTGLVNSWILVGPDHVVDLFASAYGQLLAAKLVLFIAMLGLGAVNRFTLTPLLAKGPDGGSLRTSLIVETVLAILVLACVAALGVQPPPGAG